VVAVTGEQRIALERRIDGDQRNREDRHILPAQRVGRDRRLRCLLTGEREGQQEREYDCDERGAGHGGKVIGRGGGKKAA
jgi:hypothetical protein